MPLPNQFLTMAEKAKRNQETGLTNIEETIQYYIDSSGWKTELDEINKLFAAVEGKIDYADYKSIFGSTNQDSGANMDFMYKAKLQNHNILMGIVNLLLGEFGTRSHEYEVISQSPDDDIAKQQGLSLIIKEWHKKKFLMDFQKTTGVVPSEENPMPELQSLIDNYNTTYAQATQIKGQEALNFIKSYCDIDHKLMDAFYDWIVTGGCYTYKDVVNKEVVYEYVPRNELFVLNMPTSGFVEDAEVHIRRRVLSPYAILEVLQGEVDDEQIKAFEQEVNNGYTEYNEVYTNTGANGAMGRGYGSLTSNIPMSAFTNGLELFHVVYTSYKDVYILSYIDEFGEAQEKEVTTDYELQPELGDITINKEWYTCKIQGYKVMDYFFKTGEVPFDRSDVDSKGKLKACYNGILNRTRIGEVNSIVKEGLVYQRTLNVIKFSMEKLINKNKDKILVMPYGMVPRSKGISTAKQAYHMDATSVLWVDETSPNAAFAAQMIKSIDMSLNSIIKELSELAKDTKAEYWDTIGMNAQRYSDVNQNAGKGTTEQAIVRSAIITYELTRAFDKMLEKDYQGLLDVSKYAWINGIKESYIYSDTSRGVFELNIDDANYHASSNYNVFVKDATSNTRGIEAMRSFAAQMIQNGAQASAVSKMYTTNSTAKVSTLLEKMEKAQQLIAQEAAKAEQEGAAQLKEMEAEIEAMKTELKTYEIDKRLEGTMYTADKMLEAKLLDKDNSTDLPVVEDNSFEEQMDIREANRKEKMDRHTIQKDNKELAIKAKALAQRKTTTSK